MKHHPLLALCSCLLAGCAGNFYDFPLHTYGRESPSVGELIDFQSDFAHKSPASRSEECRTLSQRQRETPHARWILRLMLGRALSEACGDVAKLLRAYDNLTARNVLDQPVAGMAAYQAEILRRVGTGGRKGSIADRKTKSEPTLKTGKDESKLLREKIEAIRSIEKKMDEQSTDDSQE